MCGHAGLMIKPRNRTNKQWADIRSYFNGLMFAMEQRGGDGIGAAVIGHEGEILAHVRLPNVSAWEAAASPEWRKLMETIGPRARHVIGHTRLATQGGDTENNYHPFVAGSIIGAHNGTIINYEEIIHTFNLSEFLQGECDSEAIFAGWQVLSGNKPLSFQHIDLLTKTLEGSYAIAVMDSREPSVFWLIRGQNPLSYSYDKALGVTGYASTPVAFYNAYCHVNAFRAASAYQGIFKEPKVMNINFGYAFKFKNGEPEDAMRIEVNHFPTRYFKTRLNKGKDYYDYDYYWEGTGHV